MPTTATMLRSLEKLDLSSRDLHVVAAREREKDPGFAKEVERFAQACDQITGALRKLTSLAADLRLREKKESDPVWASSLRDTVARLDAMADSLAKRVEELSYESSLSGST